MNALKLRPINWQDAEEIFIYAKRPEVSRFMPWNPHQSLNDTFEYISTSLNAFKEGTYVNQVIVEKNLDQVIGTISLRKTGYGLFLGYALNSDHWGKGYATESSREVIKWGFMSESVTRIQAYVDLENHASARVLQKCGLTQEGIAREAIVVESLGPKPRDMRLFGITRSEYSM